MTAHCFEQVKNLLVILLTLNKLRLSGYFDDFGQAKLLLGWLLLVSKITTKLPWEKLDSWAFFGHHLMSLTLHPDFWDLWRSPPALNSTPTWDFLFLSFECLGIHFFNLHSHVSCRMPCHARGHSHSCIRKQMISLGMAIILNIYLCSHT